MVDAAFAKAIPLVQAVQTLQDGTMERAFLETFVRESDVMAALPIMPATNGKYVWYQEEELPTVQNRAYNEPGHRDLGKTSKQEEGIFLMDEYIPVDRAIVDNLNGAQKRAEQEEMKTKAMSRHNSRLLIYGDNSSEPREADGLQMRSGKSDQTVLHNTTTSGGAGLSLAKLSAALNEVRNPTHIIVPRKLAPVLDAAARNPTITNNVITYNANDPFGRKVLNFNGLPLLFGYPKTREPDLLDFDEVASGGGSAVTASIYVVNFSQDGVFMIEGTPLTVKDEGQLQGQPIYSTHVKWDLGFVSKEYSICRLDSIANAAITA